MNRINILKTLLLVALLSSCSRSEGLEGLEEDLLTSGSAISFNTEELSADWGTKASTRGVAVDEDNLTTQASTIMVYAFMSEPADYVTACYIDNQAATYSATDGLWRFNPAQYYLMHESLALDFLAYTPEPHAASDSDNNGISQSLTDFDNKEITITYSVPTTGRNQPDLMLATPQTGRYEYKKLDDLVLNHVLTQVSMSACVGESTATGRYKITRFSMHDITIAGSLTYSVGGGIGEEWVESTNGFGEFITSAMLPDEDLGEEPLLLTNEMLSIMTNGHTLFMIPQEIETRSTPPTIQITITDTKPTTTTEYVENSEGDYVLDTETGEYVPTTGVGTHEQVETTTYLVYRTDRLALPSPDGDDAGDIGDGWLQGQHVNLQFEFDVDENQEVIPLSFTAKLMNWIEVDVNKEIDASIYVYLDVDSIAANTVTTVTLYTNGVIDAEYGVTFEETAVEYTATEGGYSITIPSSEAGDAGEKTLKVYIENSDETTITKNFPITVQ